MSTAEPAVAARGGSPAAPPEQHHRLYGVEIFVVSLAALLIEISYTRVISYKLFYYYTYLVIGLALLGLGTGGVLVAVSSRLRRAHTDTIVWWSLLLGAVSIVVGYVIVAYCSIDTLDVWRYTLSSVTSIVLLLVICLSVFAAFVGPGIMLSTLFGRRPERIGPLYFADLVGAGLACAVVIYLNARIGPPATIMLSAFLLAGAGLEVAYRSRSRWIGLAGAVSVVSVVLLVAPWLLPAQRLEHSKSVFMKAKTIYSAWSPIFRIDVEPAPGNPDIRNLFHDGLLGSAMYRWNGHVSSLGRYHFDQDARSLPFAVLDTPPGKEAIIGAAGGHEVLVSLQYRAKHVDAVELNPATYDLVVHKYAGFDGHLAQNPAVNYVNGDGRSYMARSDKKYNLVWYPAPDSYAATNAATAGAFVLSESYLYTTNAVVDILHRLNDGGIFAAQFGEGDFEHSPYRTTRFAATARKALADMGIKDPTNHIMVSRTTTHFLGSLSLSTIVVKKTPFTQAEIDRFQRGVTLVPGSSITYAPGTTVPDNPVATVVTSNEAQLHNFYDSYKYDVTPTSDNDPYFWHFARYGSVVNDFFQPIRTSDREYSVGERVLVLLLIISMIIAAVFLLLPFVKIRETWVRMPRKGRSALFFASLGFGFIFFEITLMQLLNLFLGYPTYSLTVTLLSLLLFTGVGALLSARERQRVNTVPVLVVGITALTIFYVFGLTPMTKPLLDLPLALRVVIAFAALAPLGVCLGMFMPLGLEAVSKLGDYPREYVAWSWAVNGFASVTGSVLATILAMMFGFQVVLCLGLAAYLLALVAWRSMRPREMAATQATVDEPTAEAAPV